MGNFGTDALLFFEIRVAQKRVVSKINAKFHYFDFRHTYLSGVIGRPNNLF